MKKISKADQGSLAHTQGVVEPDGDHEVGDDQGEQKVHCKVEKQEHPKSFVKFWVITKDWFKHKEFDQMKLTLELKFPLGIFIKSLEILVKSFLRHFLEWVTGSSL